MAKSQMNVRIDEDTKRAGDEVFASLGYNPTQVVGIVWQFAASKQNDRRRVKRMLENCKMGTEPEEIERCLRVKAAIEKHRQLLSEYRETMASYGVNPEFTLPEMTNEEMHERAFEERAREKGWL